MLILLAGPMAVRGRHLDQLPLPLSKGEYVISKLHFFFILTIYRAFLWLTPYVCLFIFFFFFFNFFIQVDLKPLSVYHPTSGEVSIAMGMPMEGFFDGADIVAEAMTSTSTTA